MPLSVFRPRTLQISITTLFLSLISTAFLIVMVFTYFKNSHSLLQSSKIAAEQLGAHLSDNLRFQSIDAQETVKPTAALVISKSDFSFTNTRLINYLLVSVQNDNHFSRLYVASADGVYIEAGNLGLSNHKYYISDPKKLLPDGSMFWVRFNDLRRSPSTEMWLYKDANLNTIGQESFPTDFDPRTRPWYKGAMETKELFWTNLYHFYDTHELGISASAPIYSENKELIGVAAADLSFVLVKHFLSEEPVGLTGGVVILDNSGELVFSGENVTIPPGVIASIYREYTLTNQKRVIVENQKIKYLADVNPSSHIFGTDWLIVVFAPLSDLFADIIHTQMEVVLITIGILIAAGAVVVFFAKRVSSPIVKLSQEVNKIKNFDLSSNVRVSSRITEIELMDSSIAAMRSALRSFSRYVPKEIVRDLIEKGEDILLGGKKKEITILFSDITDFTSITESFPTETVTSLLAKYFDGLSKVILSYHGTIDKYIGDSIMVFWGAPLTLDEHSIQACLTALACKKFISQFNAERKVENSPLFNTRFGIHTGSVIVGNVGTSERMNYTIMGDAANLAFRLQAACKVYDQVIIISQAVYDNLDERFLVRPLDVVELKGKKKKSKIYELKALLKGDPTLLATEEEIFLCMHFTKAYEAFHHGSKTDAKDLFEELLQKFPDDVPTQLYLQRLTLLL